MYCQDSRRSSHVRRSGSARGSFGFQVLVQDFRTLDRRESCPGEALDPRELRLRLGMLWGVQRPTARKPRIDASWKRRYRDPPRPQAPGEAGTSAGFVDGANDARHREAHAPTSHLRLPTAGGAPGTRSADAACKALGPGGAFLLGPRCPRLANPEPARRTRALRPRRARIEIAPSTRHRVPAGAASTSRRPGPRAVAAREPACAPACGRSPTPAPDELPENRCRFRLGARWSLRAPTPPRDARPEVSVSLAPPVRCQRTSSIG